MDMAEPKKKAEVEESQDEVDVTQYDVVADNWEFLDRVPTREQVKALLDTLPEVWGVRTVDFIDFVQALPQNKKTRVPHPDPERAERGVTVEKTMPTYTLYMSVAGRVKMIERAAQQNGWEVSFVPEAQTVSGTKGLLDDGRESGRLVYREYVVIYRHVEDDEKTDLVAIGSKPGMAWVPYTGGRQAAGSNPFEKVETSARGRAIAAWGFGVLPGSGIASLEEVMGVGQNRAAMNAEQATGEGRQGRGQSQRESRADLISRTMTVAEELRQERGIDEDESRQKMAEYLAKSFGVDIEKVWNDDDKTIVWREVKDGQILLLCNSLTDALRKLRDAGSDV